MIGRTRAYLPALGSPHGAAASTAAVKLLSRHFLQRPQVYAATMACMVQYYMEDMKAAGREPDRKLLGPILRILWRSAAFRGMGDLTLLD